MNPALLSVEELERYSDTMLFAKVVVEGYMMGRHRSPREGHAVEFFDYRAYVEGEDVAKVDWRVYARSGQKVCRRRTNETDMSVHLLLDSSASMDYGLDPKRKKSMVCARIAAALTYLVIRQGDKVSYTRFGPKLLEHFPVGGTRRHLMNVLNSLDRHHNRGGTQLAKTLASSQGLLKQRGRLVIISDFWENLEESFAALSWYVHRRFDILLFKVNDPGETHLRHGERVRFIDMETKKSVDVQPAQIQEQYERAYAVRQQQWKELAKNLGIQAVDISSQQPYQDAIEAFLGIAGMTPPQR